jgi:hypothetical protein
VVAAAVTAPKLSADPAESAGNGAELAGVIDRAEALFGRGMASRVRAAVVEFTLGLVVAALAIVERRNRRPGTKPVESWGFVLKTLVNLSREGPPPVKAAAAPPPRARERPAEPSPQEREATRAAIAALRRALQSGEDPAEAMAQAVAGVARAESRPPSEGPQVPAAEAGPPPGIKLAELPAIDRGGGTSVCSSATAERIGQPGAELVQRPDRPETRFDWRAAAGLRSASGRPKLSARRPLREADPIPDEVRAQLDPIWWRNRQAARGGGDAAGPSG